MYLSRPDAYFSNHKASILFITDKYEPRNDAELELLEQLETQWKVEFVGERKKAEQEAEPKAEPKAKAKKN